MTGAIQAFTTLPTIDGFDVIDNVTGHAVDHRDTLQQANGVAFRMNNAEASRAASYQRSGTNVPNPAPRQGKRP